MISFITKLFVFICLFHDQINCLYTVDKYRRITVHFRCRNDFYPGTNFTLARQKIAEEEVLWSEEPFFPYKPPCYTAKEVLENPIWADPVLNDTNKAFRPHYNLHHLSIDRVCCGNIYLVNGSCPINPIGRTGMRGRGCLGRWGPNQQVHFVVARWMKDANNSIMIHPKSNQSMFEFIGVKRKDDLVALWAVPGQFIRPKQDYLSALKECFKREIINNYSKTPQNNRTLQRVINRLFLQAVPIYRGYVDDWRNTDNAWISTTVVMIFDNKNLMDKFILDPGPSLSDVQWLNISVPCDHEFFGNHEDFINDTARVLGAHYKSEELTMEEKIEQNKKFKTPTSSELANISTFEWSSSEAPNVTYEDKTSKLTDPEYESSMEKVIITPRTSSKSQPELRSHILASSNLPGSSLYDMALTHETIDRKDKEKYISSKSRTYFGDDEPWNSTSSLTTEL